MNRLLVAIDGPAGSGKSTVAREVARRLGLINVNTGATYRAVAFLALREGVDMEGGQTLASIARRIELDGERALADGEPIPDPDLRTPEVSAAASQVSAHPEVRSVLLGVQRAAAEQAGVSGGAVVEGRDIGTVVLPDAEVKIFLSASPAERARRRAVQTNRRHELERIREALATRDRRDAERAVSPLKAAPDAIEVDTTDLSLEEVISRVMALVESARRAADA